MTAEKIEITSKVRFMTPDAAKQQGQVFGFIERNGERKICIYVTNGAGQGRTVYLSEDWIIEVVG